ncbi:MAG: GNAT family N-acetyltransferase [Pseudomonadota bacterium]
MNTPHLNVIQQPGDAQVTELREYLRRYNISLAGEYSSPSFLITHRSDKDELMGGVFAFMRFQWLVIDVLWVHETQRRRGLGALLLQEAEGIALSQGIKRFRLNTGSFQTGLGLYQKQGYEIFAQLPCTNPVNSRMFEFTDYYLKKEVE